MWTDENRGRYDRSHLRYPSDLTDAEWDLIRPLMPPRKRGGRPIHRTLLLEHCRECPPGGGNSRIRWNRAKVTVGGCGHDLAAQRGEDAGSCLGAAAVYQRCGLSCDGPELPPAFASLPLQDLLDVLFFLGRMDLVVASGNDRQIAQKEMLTKPGILEAGAMIALGWPGSFEDLAQRIRTAHGDEVAFSKQYDALHRFMAKCGEAPYADLLRTAYAAHLASRGDVSDGAWPVFLSKPNAVAPAVTKTEAKALLGLGHRSFSALTEQSLWTDLVPLLPGRKGNQYELADVLALKEKLDRLVTPGALDELLGIGRGKGAQLCDAGLSPSTCGSVITAKARDGRSTPPTRKPCSHTSARLPWRPRPGARCPSPSS